MNSLLASLIPPDDAARLQALERYQLLDASSEKILDDVVATTARLFRVSNAMVSIVERNAVLVKAPYQLPDLIERIPREQSICASTILQDETVVFEDLNQASVPGIDMALVQRLGLHFYAGHNLRTPDGHNLGTLCLLDGPPRRFPPAERHLLGQLAALVMHLLELRRIMGPHSGLTAMLWSTIYQSISQQLAVLNTLAKRPATASSLLPPAVAQEAEVIVINLDQLVAATLRRK